MAGEKTVFISYAHEDEELARKIAYDLDQRGIKVWIDFREIKIGDSLTAKISEGIRQADYVLVLLTKSSVESTWVTREVQAAFQKDSASAERVLIPAVYGDVQLPPFLQDLRYADFSASYDNALNEIIRSIEPTSDTSAQVSPYELLKSKDFVKVLAEEVAKVINVGPEGTRAEDISDEDDDPTLVFVIMSFKPEMDPIFEGIRAAGLEYGLRAERVKDVQGDYKVTSKILNMIERAKLVVADLTYERPNVYFELGYARGIGKTVITVVREGTKVHFDVQDWAYVEYNDSRVLEDKLRKRFAFELGLEAPADS